MPGENHLTYFKVQNFKRFKELEVKDMGQFNLVLGDNNVGKTSFLEALLFDLREKPTHEIKGLIRAFFFRGFGDLTSKNFLKYITNVEKYFGENDVRIKFFDKEGSLPKKVISISQRIDTSNIKVKDGRDDEESIKQVGLDEALADLFSDTIAENVFIPDLLQDIQQFQIPFIPFGNNYSQFLTNFYGEFLSKDKIAKAQFFASLRQLFPEIERLEPAPGYYENSLALDVERKEERYSVPLAFYGEGLIKLVNVLAVVSYYHGKRIMIDEIDTGIHYSRMKDFWRRILLAAKENDVQLFATTHNLECIRYFKEALEELPDLQQKARTIKLVEHLQTKEVFAQTHQFGVLEKELAIGNEVR